MASTPNVSGRLVVIPFYTTERGLSFLKFFATLAEHKQINKETSKLTTPEGRAGRKCEEEFAEIYLSPQFRCTHEET